MLMQPRPRAETPGPERPSFRCSMFRTSRRILCAQLPIASVEWCALSDSVLCNQNHAEPCFAFHHAIVSIGSLFERSCLDHRADVLQDAEGKGVLGFNRRAG